MVELTSFAPVSAVKMSIFNNRNLLFRDHCLLSINMTVEVLGADDGVDKLIAELDKRYKKDGT